MATSSNTGIWASLSRLHPAWYMLIYVISIFVFTIVYYCVSSDLYSPYAYREPVVEEDRNQLASIIQQAVVRQIKRAPFTEIIMGDWHVEKDSLRVLDADSPDGKRINFQLSAVLDMSTPQGGSVSFVRIPVSFPSEPGEVVRKAGYNRSWPNNVRPTKFEIDRAISKDQRHAKIIYSEIFKSYGESEMIDESLVFSYADNMVLRNFVSGVRGNSSMLAGTWARVLYFSTTVITTVGFGDIVPLTPIARMATALEAVIGVLILGLFLNAAAYRATH